MNSSHKGFIAPLLLILIAILLIGGGAYVYMQKKQVDQSMTTDSAVQPASTTPTQTSLTKQASDSQTADWKTYTNNELGISFLYPNEIKAEIVSTNTGRIFGAAISLSSGAKIYLSASTKDYTFPREQYNFREGFIVKNGKYYLLNNGNVSDIPFVPAEIWKLNNGSSALVVYGQDPSYSGGESPINVVVNIPNQNFTGIGFLWSNIDTTGSHPISQEDVAIFKEIVTSLQFIK